MHTINMRSSHIQQLSPSPITAALQPPIQQPCRVPRSSKRRVWWRRAPFSIDSSNVAMQAHNNWASSWDQAESASSSSMQSQRRQQQSQRQQQEQHHVHPQQQQYTSRGSSLGQDRRSAPRTGMNQRARNSTSYGHSPERSPERTPQPYRMVLKQATQVNTQDKQPSTGLSVTWLGTSSGAPSLHRNVSCTAVRSPTSCVLVDCGEGSHRQLMTAGIPLHQVSNIYITHLHGDHCFGLGSTLQAIDAAKVAQQQQQQAGSDIVDDSHSTAYVWGPPGTAQLLHAQLVLTGVAQSLKCRVLITELVTDVQDGALTPQLLAPACAHIQVRRLPPRPVAQVPALAQAYTAVAPALASIPQVWQPRHWQLSARRPSLSRFSGADDSGVWALGSDDLSDDEAELVYGGKHYLAEDGLVWDLLPPGVHPTSQGLRCLAAQLQHRVPCWGYAIQEVQAVPGMRRRKVVVLGDTINSRAMGPLALGCDVLAHEATFIEGMEDKCRVAQHSTGWMAGAFAAAVRARTLVLTHFSARYHRGAETGRPPIGRDGKPMREREISAEEEAQQQTQAIRSLIDEAQSQHPSGQVLAATDFFTLHVPLQPAPPLSQQISAGRALAGSPS